MTNRMKRRLREDLTDQGLPAWQADAVLRGELVFCRRCKKCRLPIGQDCPTCESTAGQSQVTCEVGAR